MDFARTEDEQALVDLAATIIADKVSHESLRALESSGARVDRPTWQALADAGIVGALLPEADGGSGLGVVAAGGVLEVVGRYAAAVPFLSTVVAGASTVAAFGTAEQRSTLLPGVIDGSTLIAVVPDTGVSATATETGSNLNGVASFVADGLDADVLLVRAGTPGAEEDAVYIVPADAVGVERVEQRVTTGYSDATITFADVSMVDGDSLSIGALTHMIQHLEVGLCALTAGLCQGAVNLAAEYTKQRMQFGRVIASFQAVSQRVGDSYIDLQGIELTSHQAAWRLDAGVPAEREIAIARWWAAEASNRIVHASVHVHGGVGVDRDYPLHRHFLLARKLELSFGNSEHQLAQIGAALSSPAGTAS